MATALPADLIDVTTEYALEEKKKLQKHFARFDILFFLICTLVGLDTIGAAASYGAQAFTWLIFLGLFFFVPYALLTAELGSAFPEEGGPYVWTRLAFGRGVAAVNALIYWISNPIWTGGTLALLALTAFEEFFNGGNALPARRSSGRRRSSRCCSSSASSGSRSSPRSSRSRSASGSRRSARGCASSCSDSSRSPCSSTRGSTACTACTPATSSPRTRCSSASCRSCSSTTWASSCRARPARR